MRASARVQLALGMQPREPDGRRSSRRPCHRRDPQRVLGHPDAIAERRLARIARPRVDPVQDDHHCPFIASTASTSSTTAVAWAMIRQRISLFCPRELIRPVPNPPIPKASTPSVAKQAAIAR